MPATLADMTNHTDSILNRSFYSVQLYTEQGTETFAAETLGEAVSIGFMVARVHDIAVTDDATAEAVLTVFSHERLLVAGERVITAEGVRLLDAFRSHPLTIAAHQRTVAQSVRASA